MWREKSDESSRQWHGKDRGCPASAYRRRLNYLKGLYLILPHGYGAPLPT